MPAATTEPHLPELRHDRVAGHGGVGLHVVRAGSGPPVLLLHGFPENWRSWQKQIAPLVAAGFSVHVPDLRGYGDSDKPSGVQPYRIEHLVGDIAALVRATGHDRAHVVGHDWGGVIAWAFAAAHPELLDRLAILNAPHPGLYFRRACFPPQMFKSSYVLLFLVPGLAERVLSAGNFRVVRWMFRQTPARKGAFTEGEIDALVEPLSRPGSLTAGLNYYRANVPRAGTSNARHARTDAETLVLWGEKDPALSTSLLKGLGRYAPRLRIVRFPDAGHWLQNEAPAEVNAALIEFLRDPAP